MRMSCVDDIKYIRFTIIRRVLPHELVVDPRNEDGKAEAYGIPGSPACVNSSMALEIAVKGWSARRVLRSNCLER